MARDGLIIIRCCLISHFRLMSARTDSKVTQSPLRETLLRKEMDGKKLEAVYLSFSIG